VTITGRYHYQEWVHANFSLLCNCPLNKHLTRHKSRFRFLIAYVALGPSFNNRSA